MTCRRVGSWKNRPTFEELAVMFEGSTASGAERAYRRAVDKLTELLVAEGAIHADFENGTAEIIRLADWDTIKTNWFANEAIRYILSLSPDALKIYARPP